MHPQSEKSSHKSDSDHASRRLRDRVIVGIMAIQSVFALAACNATGSPIEGGPETILNYYGRTNGLCAVVSASPEIPAPFVAELAGKGLAVHVIATDEAARAKLVKSMMAAKPNTAVSVENISVPPLPYVDNLVNLLIVDDAGALTAKGLKADEIQRVVAPGGVIAARKDGKWDLSRKPWPTGMDEWTHPIYDASGNRYSKDQFIKFPLSYKWIDGIGVPLFGAGCAGWVISNGRCFAISASETENFNLAVKRGEDIPYFLVARDAFNGLVLWKQPLGPQKRPGLGYRNLSPIASDANKVYAVQMKKLAAFDAASGQNLFTCDNEFSPAAMRLSKQVLITSGTGQGPDGPTGAVEAFDANTGRKLWTQSVSTYELFASNSKVFVLSKADKTPRYSIFGYDLATGKQTFCVTDQDLGGNLRILSVGEGYLLVNCGNNIVALSSMNGGAMWKINSTTTCWGPVIDGQFWHESTAYDVMTGKPVKTVPRLLLTEMTEWIDPKDPSKGTDLGCNPLLMVNDTLVNTRHSRFQQVVGDELKFYFFRGARAGCNEGMTPAEGMLITAPRDCVCVATHPYGFISIGPVGSNPTTEEFTTNRNLEKGEAYGTLGKASLPASPWPMYRGTPERNSASDLPVASQYRKRWQAKVTPDSVGSLVEDSYISRCLPRLSPPVYGEGNVYVAVAEPGEVVALNEKTGTESWLYRAGSRIETSPTFYNGGCFFGCNDGYVYSLRASDGKLMWRVRIAPRERRIMDHGVMESSWPVFGSVLVYKDTLYTSAGRNSESDGGVVIVALDPATGQQKWARHIDRILVTKNDLLSIVNKRIAWKQISLDPKTGDGDLLEDQIKSPQNRSGLWDSINLAVTSARRLGTIFTIDDKSSWMMAWNDKYIVGGESRQPRPATAASRPAQVPKAFDVAMRKGKLTGQVTATRPAETESLFKMSGQPTAIIACSNAAVAGYGGAGMKNGLITIYPYDNSTPVDIPLDSGVVHNGLAIMRKALVASMTDGSVAFYEAVIDSGSAGFVQRVNCGGKEYKDSKGIVWSADQEYKPGQWGYEGGGSVDRTKSYSDVSIGASRKHVAGPDEYMYITEHYGMSAYRFAVPNGHYAVTLHMTETYYSGADMVMPNGDCTYWKRRFNVAINGEKVLNDLDLMKENGGKSHIPVIKRFDTDVVNGELLLRFMPIEESPVINAIEIIGLPETATK